MEFAFNPLGDNAVIIRIADTIEQHNQKKIQAIITALNETKPNWFIELIPAFTTVTVFYNPLKTQSESPYEEVCNKLYLLLKGMTAETNVIGQFVEIPVVYGGVLGPDLAYVAKYNGLSIDEVIRIHTESIFDVSMIGFAPGFPFLSGMSKRIATPRKSTPRLVVPAGSVGIAGFQTGIYPIETPGGWQIIGHTLTRLFRSEQKIPSLLKAGDRIKFTSIRAQERSYMSEDV